MSSKKTVSGNVMVNLSITANVLTHHKVPAHAIGAIVLGKDQANIMRTGENEYDVSYPMTESDHFQNRALIHRLNNEMRNTSKPPTDPDDKPPRPTNPRGSGGKVVKFENTLAIAA